MIRFQWVCFDCGTDVCASTQLHEPKEKPSYCHAAAEVEGSEGRTDIEWILQRRLAHCFPAAQEFLEQASTEPDHAFPVMQGKSRSSEDALPGEAVPEQRRELNESTGHQ